MRCVLFVRGHLVYTNDMFMIIYRSIWFSTNDMFMIIYRSTSKSVHDR